MKNVDQKHKKYSIPLGAKDQNCTRLMWNIVEFLWNLLPWIKCLYSLKKMQLNPYVPFVPLVFNQYFNHEEKIKGENPWDNYFGKRSWRFKWIPKWTREQRENLNWGFTFMSKQLRTILIKQTPFHMTCPNLILHFKKDTDIPKGNHSKIFISWL